MSFFTSLSGLLDIDERISNTSCEPDSSPPTSYSIVSISEYVSCVSKSSDSLITSKYSSFSDGLKKSYRRRNSPSNSVITPWRAKKSYAL